MESGRLICSHPVRSPMLPLIATDRLGLGSQVVNFGRPVGEWDACRMLGRVMRCACRVIVALAKVLGESSPDHSAVGLK